MKNPNRFNKPLIIRFVYFGLYPNYEKMSERISKRGFNDNEYYYISDEVGYWLYIISSSLTQDEQKLYKLNF